VFDESLTSEVSGLGLKKSIMLILLELKILC